MEWTMANRTLEDPELEKPLGIFRSILEKCDWNDHYYYYHSYYKYQCLAVVLSDIYDAPPTMSQAVCRAP